MATRAVDSRLWVRRLLNGETPIRCDTAPQSLTMGTVPKTSPFNGTPAGVASPAVDQYKKPSFGDWLVKIG